MPDSQQVKHIAIAGNIGAGKTTLATLLAKHFNWEVHYEVVESNPYLEDFYEDMKRWSFNLQIYFLNSRFKQLVEIRKGEKTIVQDRTIYEDAKIFAPNLYEMELMTERDYENYCQMFETLSSYVTPPDLMIYLRASVPTLVRNIQKRGREFEENLRLDYLKRLNNYYENWIGEYDNGPLLIIDVNEMDFAEKAEDLGDIINRISAELNGLF